MFYFLCTKIFFHFPSVKSWYFLRRPYQKYVVKLGQTICRKYYTTFYVKIIKWLPTKSLPSTSHEKYKFLAIRWKRVKLELQVLCSLLIMFWKNHFRYTIIYFFRDTSIFLQDSMTSYERSCLQFWQHFEIGTRNSK